MVNLESIDPLKVDFRVPEVYLKQVQVGQTLQVSLDALPGRSYEGSVFAINPLVDAAGRAIVIRAQVRNADTALRPGMFARVRLLTKDEREALVLPEQALVPQGEEQFVFRVARRQGGADEGGARPAPRRPGRDPQGRRTRRDDRHRGPAQASRRRVGDRCRVRRRTVAAPPKGERERRCSGQGRRRRAATGAEVLIRRRRPAMLLPEICIKRPVFATVLSLIILLIGLISYTRLSVREYPRIDEPVVSVAVTYRGASAEVVESQVTKPLEDSLAGIEGVEVMTSSSRSETAPDQRPLLAEARPRLGGRGCPRQGRPRPRQAARHDRRADHRQGRGGLAAGHLHRGRGRLADAARGLRLREALRAAAALGAAGCGRRADLRRAPAVDAAQHRPHAARRRTG